MKEKNKVKKITKNNNNSIKNEASNKKKLVEIPPLTNIANEQIVFIFTIKKNKI